MLAEEFMFEMKKQMWVWGLSVCLQAFSLFFKLAVPLSCNALHAQKLVKCSLPSALFRWELSKLSECGIHCLELPNTLSVKPQMHFQLLAVDGGMIMRQWPTGQWRKWGRLGFKSGSPILLNLWPRLLYLAFGFRFLVFKLDYVSHHGPVGGTEWNITDGGTLSFVALKGRQDRKGAEGGALEFIPDYAIPAICC